MELSKTLVPVRTLYELLVTSTALLLFLSSTGCSSTSHDSVAPQIIDSSSSKNIEATHYKASAVLSSIFTLKAYNSSGSEIGQASGFSIPEGRLVTNFHVIKDADWIEVQDNNGSVVASIDHAIAIDEDADLVILPLYEIDVPFLTISTESATVGDDIWAFGSPMGLDGTVSKGIVAALRSFSSRSFLQITAPISPGSSGGPVIDRHGQVIGVVVATLSTGQNLNFAVESKELLDLAIKEGQRIPFSSYVAEPAQEAAEDEAIAEFTKLLIDEIATEIRPREIMSAYLDKDTDINFHDSPFHLYRIHSKKGDVVSIDVISNSIDPFLAVSFFPNNSTNPSWTGSDDDSGYNFDAKLSIETHEDGSYLVYVGNTEEENGGYLIAVNRQISSFRNQLSSRWLPLVESDEDIMFLDSQTIERKSYGSSYAWLKKIRKYLDASTPDLGEHYNIQQAFDCGRKMTALRHATLYHGNETIITHTNSDYELKWSLIVPGTIIEPISQIVCQ